MSSSTICTLASSFVSLPFLIILFKSPKAPYHWSITSSFGFRQPVHFVELFFWKCRILYYFYVGKKQHNSIMHSAVYSNKTLSAWLALLSPSYYLVALWDSDIMDILILSIFSQLWYAHREWSTKYCSLCVLV